MATKQNSTWDDVVVALRARHERLAHYQVQVKPGRSGPWTIERFEVTETLELARLVRDGRGCAPGTYTRLVHDVRGVVMSDTDAEVQDFLRHLNRMRGRVLVGGLGLGMCVHMMLASDRVRQITILEKDAHVIKLSAPQFADCPRVHIIKADALTWRQPDDVDFDCAWWDIWDGICSDNLAEIKTLRWRYSRIPKSRQYAWSETELRELGHRT